MSRRKKSGDENPVSFFSFQDIIMCATAILVFITLLLLIDLINRKAADPNALPVPVSDVQGTKIKELEKKRAELLKRQMELQNLIASLEDKPTLEPKEVDDLEKKVEDLRVQLADVQTQAASSEQARLLVQLKAQQQLVAAMQKELADLQALIAAAKNRPMVMGSTATIDKNAIFAELNSDNIVLATIPEDSPAQLIKTIDSKNLEDAFMKFAATKSASREYFVMLVRPDTVDLFKALRRKLRDKGFIVSWDVWVPDKSLIPNK